MTNNIPVFPEFSNLGFEHFEETREHLTRFPVYADFNPTNLYAWDVDDSARISKLQGNIVLLFKDYVTQEQFFTFLGTNNVTRTMHTLYALARKMDISTELRLVPEQCIQAARQSHFFGIHEDPDQHEYILSTSLLAHLAGGEFAHYRRAAKAFVRNYGNVARYCDLNLYDSDDIRSILEVFSLRIHATGKNGELELKAIKKVLSSPLRRRLQARGIRVNGKLCAFILHEQVTLSTSIGHFWKADCTKDGIYQFLMHKVCSELMAKGIEFFNIEQDLGIEGLRMAKRFARPVRYHRKYIVHDCLSSGSLYEPSCKRASLYGSGDKSIFVSKVSKARHF